MTRTRERFAFVTRTGVVLFAAVACASDYRVAPEAPAAARAALVAQLRPGDRLIFAAGVHDLTERLCVRGKRDVVLAGEAGTVLTLPCDPAASEDDLRGAFLFEDCARVALRNLRLTTRGHIGNQGTVVGKDETAHTLLLKVDPQFPVRGSEHYFQLNTVEADGVPDGALEVHAPIHRVPGANGAPDRYAGLDYTVAGDRLVRIRVPPRVSLACVTNGHRMLVRYFRVGEVPLAVTGCTDVTIEDVEIARTPNLGLVVRPPSRDLTLRRFSVRPAPGGGLYAASNSDAVHILGLGGCFVMEDCHFRGLGDDALNIHSMAAEVKSADAAGRVRLILRGPDRARELRLPAHWARAGDTLEVYDAQYARRGTVTLRQFDAATDAGVLAATDARPRPGDLLVNTAFYPSVRIRNCSFESTRARAVLLQTRDVKIEDCLFRGFPLPAIIFAVDFTVWNEAGPTENAEVARCRFENCARNRRHPTLGAIVVKADHDGGENERPAGIHRNLRFRDNAFDGCGASGLYVASADGVEIDGNRFTRGSLNPYLDPFNRCDIRLKNCTRVKLGTNTSDRAERLLMRH